MDEAGLRNADDVVTSPGHRQLGDGPTYNKRLVSEQTLVILRAAETTRLQAGYDVPINVYVDHPEFDLSSFTAFVSNVAYTAQKGMSVGKGLIDVWNGGSCVRVANMERKEKVLRKHDVVGVAEICANASFDTLEGDWETLRIQSGQPVCRPQFMGCRYSGDAHRIATPG